MELELSHVNTTLIGCVLGASNGIVPEENITFFRFSNHIWWGVLLEVQEFFAKTGRCELRHHGGMMMV